MRSGGRVVEGARLESEYTPKAYRGFESLPLRQPVPEIGEWAVIRPKTAERSRSAPLTRALRAGLPQRLAKLPVAKWLDQDRHVPGRGRRSIRLCIAGDEQRRQIGAQL